MDQVSEASSDDNGPRKNIMTVGKDNNGVNGEGGTKEGRKNTSDNVTTSRGIIPGERKTEAESEVVKELLTAGSEVRGGGSDDMLVLELRQGRPHLLLDLGGGAVSLGLNASYSLADNTWHRIDLIWKDQVRSCNGEV